MKQQTVITTNIVVPPHKLHVKREYIEKEIVKYEQKNYSNDIGYIYRILDILSIENLAVVQGDFSGNVVYRVKFMVENCNPEVGSTIDCEILHSTAKITLAKNDPLKIIIVNEPGLPKLETGNQVTIEILCKEINYGAENIKIVGRFQSKK